MTVSTRKRTDISARRQEVAARYLRGELMVNIGKELGVDTAQISRDLKALREEWRQSALVNMNEAKAKELAKIDNLEVEYWQAWENSKRNAEIDVTEQIGTRAKSKPGEKDQAETSITPMRIKKYKRVEGQSGNPAFLAGIQWCINKRCEIFGLDAPKKAEITGEDGGPVKIERIEVILPHDDTD